MRETERKREVEKKKGFYNDVRLLTTCMVANSHRIFSLNTHSLSFVHVLLIDRNSVELTNMFPV
jgi:hypothetical protein